MHGLAAPSAPSAPSAWVQRFTPLLQPGSRVLDLACGSGRHLQWLAGLGHHVTGVDRDAEALARAEANVQDSVLASAQANSQANSPASSQASSQASSRTFVAGAELLLADVEAGPWPLAGRQFDAIVVTNYLWRPLFPTLMGALAEGGIYLHETFADGHQHIGRPSRPDFLLQRGELLRVCARLRVIAFEDGYEPGPAGGPEGARCVQRIAAVNETAAAGIQARWSLGMT